MSTSVGFKNYDLFNWLMSSENTRKSTKTCWYHAILVPCQKMKRYPSNLFLEVPCVLNLTSALYLSLLIPFLCSLFFLSSMEQFPPDVLCHSVALIKKCLLPSSSLLCSRQEVQQMMFPVRKSMQGIGISAFHKNSPVDAINNKTSLVYITTVVIHSLVSYLHCYLRTKLSHLCPMQNL